MVMTNYMDLLAANQPWNLILFMVVPVVLAESLVATEFMMAYRGTGKRRRLEELEPWSEYRGRSVFRRRGAVSADQRGAGHHLEGLGR